MSSHRDAERLAEWRRRLKWRCRRGMRELDIMLARFVDEADAAVERRELAAFERLLDYPDDTLLELLMGRARAPDKELADVVARIRGVAASNA